MASCSHPDAWTHVICADCWLVICPDRVPARVRDATFEACCFCDKQTAAGIYIRHDPTTLLCGKELVNG